ncbi:hypothetical protein QNH46_07920 [Paenibacillus woosongensis]|uniref:Uncharacterized protein n=1 Tax=Paenibacillus woosongensis TaxID=307580 RepID=A0AA95L2Y7_9BACL|nr:hypothetical protein [Paenibacillus woosongensis]WHX50562.1 hypothetical protein QNH46_07920 [Paenibacillus woosongensis]
MGITGGTIKSSDIVEKSQYELDKEKGFPLRNYIREIVREEIAAHEERLNIIPEIIGLSKDKKQALADYLKLNPMI